MVEDTWGKKGFLGKEFLPKGGEKKEATLSLEPAPDSRLWIQCEDETCRCCHCNRFAIMRGRPRKLQMCHWRPQTFTSERIKSAPFAITAPFADQVYDLVKHGCHFTLLSLCPQDWKLLESKSRTWLTPPYSHRQKITLEQTAAWCYNAAKSTGATQQQPPACTPTHF